MQGNFDEARRTLDRLRTLAADIGVGLRLAIMAFWSAPVERLSGDLAAAEYELRTSIEALERMGEKGYLSTMAGELGDVLYEQGKVDDAEEASRVSEQATAPGDMASEALWRTVRAKVLARRGEFDEAERLAGEALAIVRPTDYLDYRAHAHMGLAEVLRLAGREEDAAAEIHEAIGFYEAKGNLVLARQARALLSELSVEEAKPAS
jgi:tetratricopeptide (TPR) repeat protein